MPETKIVQIQAATPLTHKKKVSFCIRKFPAHPGLDIKAMTNNHSSREREKQQEESVVVIKAKKPQSRLLSINRNNNLLLKNGDYIQQENKASINKEFYKDILEKVHRYKNTSSLASKRNHFHSTRVNSSA